MLLTKQTEEKLLPSQDIRVFHRTPRSWSDFTGLKWADKRSSRERERRKLKTSNQLNLSVRVKKKQCCIYSMVDGKRVLISHFKEEGSIKTHQIYFYTALFGSAKVIGDLFQISWGWREGVVVGGWVLRENRFHADKSLAQIKRQIGGKRLKMLTSGEQ